MKTMKPIGAAFGQLGHRQSAGTRITTSIHEWSAFRAKCFEPDADFNRFEAVRILKRIGRKLPANDTEQRWTSGLLDHLELLVSMTQQQDWIARRPIVWLSVAKTAKRLGITSSQVNRHENQLMQLGAITWDDSGNHKRFGRRDDEGRIVEAYGINLAPLGTMLATLRAEESAITRAEAEREKKKNLLSALRRQCRGLLWGCDEDNAVIATLARECDAIIGAIRVRPDTDISKLDGWIAALEAWLERLKTRPAETAAADPVDNAQDSAELAPNMRTKPRENAPPAPHPGEAHIIQEESLNKNTDTCSGAVVDNASSAGGAKYRQEGGGSRGEGANSERLADVAEPITYQLDPVRLWCQLPPKLAMLVGDEPEWEDMLKAAQHLRPELGISPQAWDMAMRQLGEGGAALALILIAWRRELGLVYAPGGYLRGMVKKAKRGELHLLPSFYGLQKRQRNRRS